MCNRGVALIEVLVSVAIIGAGLVAIIQALDTCVRAADHSRQRTIALYLLESSIEEAIQSNTLSPAAPLSGRFDAPHEEYSWRWEARGIEESSFQIVVVTVEWGSAGRQLNVTGKRRMPR